MIALLITYLSDRSHYVAYNGYTSNSRIITKRCGIPQGSYQGPLLFLLRIICQGILDAKSCLFLRTSNFIQSLDLSLTVLICKGVSGASKTYFHSKCKINTYMSFFLFDLIIRFLERDTVVEDLRVHFDASFSFIFILAR